MLRSQSNKHTVILMLVQTNQPAEQNGEPKGPESPETQSCEHGKLMYSGSGTTGQWEGTELTFQRKTKPGISPLPHIKGASQVNSRNVNAETFNSLGRTCRLFLDIKRKDLKLQKHKP